MRWGKGVAWECTIWVQTNIKEQINKKSNFTQFLDLWQCLYVSTKRFECYNQMPIDEIHIVPMFLNRAATAPIEHINGFVIIIKIAESTHLHSALVEFILNRFVLAICFEQHREYFWCSHHKPELVQCNRKTQIYPLASLNLIK